MWVPEKGGELPEGQAVFRTSAPCIPRSRRAVDLLPIPAFVQRLVRSVQVAHGRDFARGLRDEGGPESGSAGGGVGVGAREESQSEQRPARKGTVFSEPRPWGLREWGPLSHLLGRKE